MVYLLLKVTLLPILRLFIKKVDGLKNIPKDRAFILAANHQSFLDPLVISAVVIPVINKKIHFFALKEGWWNFFGAYITMKWAGCIPVGRTKRSRRSALNQALNFLKNNEVVGIFPEGTRTSTGELLKARTGVAKLALRGVPVIPLGITGTFGLWPRQHKFPKFKRAVKIKIGKPMYFKAKRINKKILHEFADQVMREIGKLINKKYVW